MEGIDDSVCYYSCIAGEHLKKMPQDSQKQQDKPYIVYLVKSFSYRLILFCITLLHIVLHVVIITIIVRLD